jgi:hypothetical protein
MRPGTRRNRTIRGAAFAVFARKHGLGTLVTGEFDVAPASPRPPNAGGREEYRAQGFAGAIVYAKVGDWGNVQVLDW